MLIYYPFFQDSFSEGKEWSNDAEKSALVTEIKLYFKVAYIKIEKYYFKMQ